MLGATQPVRPWVCDEHEMMSQLELATKWRRDLPAAPRDAAMMLAARFPPGRWRRSQKVTENDWEAHQRVPSGPRGRREQPDARRELGERQPWMR